jgi:hypothetical protein
MLQVSYIFKFHSSNYIGRMEDAGWWSLVAYQGINNKIPTLPMESEQVSYSPWRTSHTYLCFNKYVVTKLIK